MSHHAYGAINAKKKIGATNDSFVISNGIEPIPLPSYGEKPIHWLYSNQIFLHEMLR